MPNKKYPLEFPAEEHGNCRALTQLTLDHLPRDGSLGRRREYANGADVWRPDDRQDSIYFLLSGQIAVMFSDPEGRETILRAIKPGEPFGELCFCGKHKLRVSIARALTASEAVEIDIADFMIYLQSNHDVLAAFIFLFCIRLADAERRIEILTHRGAEERLGRLLLHLAAGRGGTEAESAAAEVALSVSHDELAQMAAMSRPHVTLTMNKFRRHGFVQYGRNNPLVVKVSSLKSYLGSE